MKRKGKKVDTSYEEGKNVGTSDEEGKNVGTSYEEEGEECWHQL
jgi:hypothetical protein